MTGKATEMSDEEPGAARITVSLSRRGEAALNIICSTYGEGKTDAVNNALRLYAMVLQTGPDTQLYVRRHPGAEAERVHLP